MICAIFVPCMRTDEHLLPR